MELRFSIPRALVLVPAHLRQPIGRALAGVRHVVEDRDGSVRRSKDDNRRPWTWSRRIQGTVCERVARNAVYHAFIQHFAAYAGGRTLPCGGGNQIGAAGRNIRSRINLANDGCSTTFPRA